MKQSLFAIAFFLCVAFVGAQSPSSSPSASNSPSSSPSPSPAAAPSPSPSLSSVYDIIQSDNNFSHLKTALANSQQQADVKAIIDRLQNANQSTTFFAPNNKAFTDANGTVTATFLEYYLLDGTVSPLAEQLYATLLNLPSLGNATQQVKVTKSGASFVVNDASPVEQDEAASNGHVYGVAANLTLPPTMWHVVDTTSTLSIFAGLLKFSNLNTVLDNPALTGFAPVDTAFGALPAYLINFLKLNNTESNAMLLRVLTYHFGEQVLYLSKIPANATITVPTMNEGTSLTVSVGSSSNQYTVNGAKVTTADILTNNGAANIIEKVLFPFNMTFTVANALAGLGSADEYVAALKANNLLQILDQAANPYTVFVPSTVDAKASVALLNYTIVAGTHTAASLKDGQLLTTLSVEAGSLNNNGQVLKVTVTDGAVHVGGVKIATADIGVGYVTNGVIHVLADKLALPNSVAKIVASTGALSSLDSALVLAGLTDTLGAAGNNTLFAPTNDAFSGLPASVLGYLVSNSSKASNDALTYVLKYHLYNKNVLYYNDGHGNLVPGTYPMVDGGDVTVAFDQVANASVVKVNSATVLTADIAASNGVVHTIDGVLIPSGLNISNVDLLVGLGDSTLINALNRTGLLDNLKTESVTIFAPTNDAFSKLDDKSILTKSDTADLKNLLLTHVVNETIKPSDLTNNKTFTSLSGKQLIVAKNGEKVTINIVGTKDDAGTINLAASSSNLGSTTPSYVYSINQVLGEKNAGDDDGLTSTEIGLIVAGCIVAVLLAGAAVGGAVWYYKRRHGYEQIDGEAY